MEQKSLVGRGSQIHHYPSKLWFKKFSTISISQWIYPERATENEASNIAQCMIICRNRQAPMSWEAVNWFNLSEDNLCAYFTWPYPSSRYYAFQNWSHSHIAIGDESVGKVDSLRFLLTMADIAEGKDPLFSGWISLGSVTLDSLLKSLWRLNSILYDQARYLTPFD